MNIWDKVKRIFASVTAIASVGGTIAAQLPPNTQQPSEEEVVEVVSVPGNYSEEPAPFQAVMAQLSSEINKPPVEEYFPEFHIPYLPASSFNFSHAEEQINYADMHGKNSAILSERIWEIYDTYFDSQEIPESDFEAEREKLIIEIFGWFAEFTVTSIAGGILGNLAYDKLKDRIQRRQEKSTDSIGKYYEKLGKDLSLILAVVSRTEKEDKPIRVHEISLATGISKEKVRNWLKIFCFTHHSNCIWESTKRNTISPKAHMNPP